VRYEAVNAMLLNEHHKVKDLEATVVQQQKELRPSPRVLKNRHHNSRR
jgi:hypothetical protein